MDNLEAGIYKPAEVAEESLPTSFWVMISVCIFLVMLWISGIIIQYTNIGDKQTHEPGSDSPKVEEKKQKWALLFYSFNPILNLQKIFYVKEGGDKTLAALNGVRVLSICWVIVGHGFSFAQAGPAKNSTTISEMMTGKLFAIIPGGFFAVDSFFFLSGFLTFALLTAKMYPKGGFLGFYKTFLLYFHRYYRLIFPIVFVTFFTMYIVPYMYNGPVYRHNWDAFNIICERYWWTNFLFINNFHPWEMGQECIGWVWYLANDMQFFWISPPLIYIYCKHRNIGYIMLCLMILASMTTVGIMTVIQDISITLRSDSGNAMTTIYSKPWGRMGAYFVGGIFGLTYFEHSNQGKYPQLQGTTSTKIYQVLKTSRVWSMIMCTVGILITALYVFPLRNYYMTCEMNKGGPANCWDLFPTFWYNFTSRPFFVMGLGFILMPTFVGRLRVIHGFLGSEPFAVLARLNYMVYMVHCVVIFFYLSALKQADYITTISQWYFSISVSVISFLVAIPATLLWEAPFMNIEKYVLFPQNAKPAKANGEVQLKQTQKYQTLKDDETMDTQQQLMANSN